MDFLYSYIVLAEIYVLLGLSTNLLVGIVGIFSVSQAAVFGVGAYVVAHFLMASDSVVVHPVARHRRCLLRRAEHPRDAAVAARVG